MPTSEAPHPHRRSFLLRSLAAGAAAAIPPQIHAANTTPAPQQDHAYWLRQVELVSGPVLQALKEGNLRRYRECALSGITSALDRAYPTTCTSRILTDQAHDE